MYLQIPESYQVENRLFIRAVLGKEVKETYELGIPQLGIGLELGLRIRSRVRVTQT